MLTAFGFLLGLAGGAAGTAAWLLSDPDEPTSVVSAPADAFKARTGEVRVRFLSALAEGRRAGSAEETRMRHELEVYRRNPDSPAPTS